MIEMIKAILRGNGDIDRFSIPSYQSSEADDKRRSSALPVGGVKSQVEMQDTTKHDQPVETPPQQEPTRGRDADPSALARLLDEWMQGDKTEQRETFEALRRSLDEDRSSGYKLFSRE
jgi:hypothetical protein